MASADHCLMCFEALDAHLDGRKPLSLDRVQSSWAAYVGSVADSEAGPGSGSDSGSGPAAAVREDPALRRIIADSDSSSSSADSSSSASLALASTPATSTSSLPLSPGPTATPLFVTWNMVEAGDTALRGCIGTFEAQPLSVGIADYAVISAVNDSRFPPVTRAELPELQAAVTLLTDFEDVDDAYDWDIGTHGIRLSFYDRGRRYGSTYLPNVAAEQGWTKDETLFSLIRKAGWMGSRWRWRDLDLKVTRYRGKKCSMQYAEYKKWKDWVAASGQ